MEANHFPRWFNKLPVRYQASNSPETNTYTKLVFWYFLLTTVYLLWEWLSIGILSDQEKIESYMFGSAAMMGNGGENYASAETYAASALQSVVLTLPILLLFGLALKKQTRFYRLLAYASILIVALLVRMLKL